MSKKGKGSAPVWVARFLEALRAGNGVRAAAREAGVTSSTPYHRRRTDEEFAREWDSIRPVDDRKKKRNGPKPRRDAAKIEVFLEELAATSNVTAAAATADLTKSTIYKLRREDPDFARQWYAALAEGYDNLEMDLLQHLRSGESPERGGHKFDTANALRSLGAHRDSVAREKGRRSLQDEVTTIASINAKIDALRARRREGDTAIRKARRKNAKQSGRDGKE